jgi:hypothetical protein
VAADPHSRTQEEEGVAAARADLQMGCAAKHEGTHGKLLRGRRVVPFRRWLRARRPRSWRNRASDTSKKGKNPTIEVNDGDRKATEQQNYRTKTDRGWGNLTRLAGTLAPPPRMSAAQSSK